MELQLEGIVKEILPLQEGEGRNGRWRKQSFILETASGQYPRLVCIMMWGDKIDQFKLQTGETVVTSVDIESREFNGRWYTDVKAWKVEKKRAEAPAQPIPDPIEDAFGPSTSGSATNADPFASSSGDDLPF
jgi:hypothetical protein